MVTQAGAPQSRLSQRLAWARETLELGEDASPTVVRARMLRLLTDEDFVPAEACLQALRTLQADAAGVAELNDPPAFARDRERQVEAEVETFAAGMFRLPIVDRHAQWQCLREKTEQAPRAQVRLEALHRGLSIDLAPLEPRSEWTRKLSGQLCELFTLRPMQRAIRRAELARQAAGDRQLWQVAARDLQLDYDEIAGLDLILVRGLQARPAKEPPPELRPAFRDRKVLVRQSEDSGGRLLWLVPLLVFLVMLGVAQFGKNDSSSRTIPKWPKVKMPPVTITPEEYEKMPDALRRILDAKPLPPLRPGPAVPPAEGPSSETGEERSLRGDLP